MKSFTIIISLLFSINCYSKKAKQEKITLKDLVKNSSYILLANEIGINEYEIKEVLYGRVTDSGPKAQDLITVNLAKQKAAKYIPRYVSDLNWLQITTRRRIKEIIKVTQATHNSFNKFNKRAIKKVKTSGKNSRALTKSANLLKSIQRYSQELNTEIKKINFTKFRSKLVSKIIFLRRVNDDTYRMIAVNGFEHSSNISKVKKYILNRRNSNKRSRKKKK